MDERSQQQQQDIELDDKSISFDDRTEEHVSSTDDMLKMTGSGCWGCVERVPLWIKLTVMCVISIVGLFVFAILLIVFSGSSFANARLVKDASLFMNDFSVLITALQYERINSNALITFRTEENLNITIASMDQATRLYSKLSRSSYKRLNARFGDEYVEIFDTFLDFAKKIEDQRDKYISNVNYTDVVSNYDIYTETIEVLISGQSRISQLVNIGTVGVNYVIFSRIVEGMDLLMNMGSFIITRGLLDTFSLSSYYERRAEYYKLVTLWKESATIEAREFFNQTGDLPAVFTQFDAQILRETVIPSAISGDIHAYRGNMTDYLDRLRKTEKYQLQYIISEANETMNEEKASIIIIIIIFVVLSIVSVLSAFILAFSIVGPWMRLNRIQETAISRFVPRGFLKLLGCKKITDLHLGMSVEREVTMVEVSIKDIEHSITKNLKSDQIFEMLNSYLSVVGPIVRKFGGFIDKYSGDKFTALFKDTSRAVKACMEIQTAVEMFNLSVKDQYPSLAVGASVHTDKALIGAVGENERMDGVVISSDIGLRGILNSVMKRFDSNLMITHKVVEKCSKFRHLQFRKVGVIKYHEYSSTIYEIITIDKVKTQTKSDFEGALRSFEQGLYSAAIPLLERVIEADSNDAIANAYLERAKSLQAQTKLISQSLQVKDVLGSSEMRDEFHRFCKSEHSEENISLWRKVEEEFKPLQDAKERYNLAKNIYNDYLSLDGRFAININEALKKTIASKLESDQQVTESNLFDGVQRELELLMGTDTLARFKISEGFKSAFQKTSLSLKIPSVDEL